MQFTDDTFIIGDKKLSNLRAINANLLVFELASVLKVNFHKKFLVGVNVNESWLTKAAKLLNNKVRKVLFKTLDYLLVRTRASYPFEIL